MFTEPGKKYYSPEEYRAFEEQADYKSEYRVAEIVPIYKIDEHHWILTEWEGEASGLRLQSIDFELSLGELYEGVEFKG